MDTIAHALTVIRNASMAKHKTVKIRYSKIMMNIVNILKDEGYFTECNDIDEGNSKKSINIILNYDEEGDSVITKLQRISKCSRRVYVNVNKIPRIANGYATVIMSTPKGILTGKKAREENVGGEVLCYVL